MKTFDLSQYGNTHFTLALQSSCYLSDKFYAEGDNVFVDIILISNTTVINDRNNGAAGVITYPNPVTNVLNYSARGTGNQISVKVLNLQGQTILQESVYLMMKVMFTRSIRSRSSSGLYILQVAGNKGTAVKKFVIE